MKRKQKEKQLDVDIVLEKFCWWNMYTVWLENNEIDYIGIEINSNIDHVWKNQLIYA